MKNLLLLALLTFSSLLHANENIKIVVPYAAGGPIDISTRVLAKHLSVSVNTPIVIDNKPGASTAIGNSIVAKSKPDGLTLLSNTVGGFMGVVDSNPAPGYDWTKDLKIVAFYCPITPLVLAVPSSKKYRDLKHFMESARGQKLNNGFSASGGIFSAASNLWAQAANSDYEPIVYKGSPAVMSDIVNGQLDFTFITQYAVLPFVQNPNVQILGVVDDHPSAALPGVPTFKSQGYSQLTQIYEIHAIWAPADTPDAVVKKLRQEIQNLNQGAVRKELTDMQLLNPTITFSADPQVEVNNLLRRYAYLKSIVKK